jgi:serine/threonine protein kinase
MTADPLSDSNESIFPRRFGSYVLFTHLGEGGMGRVYAALTPKGQLCVVKRFGNPRAPLPAHLLEQNKARFLREAEITKALQHPVIIHTYESVHDGANSYLVQEFVSGMTLDYFMGAVSSSGQPLPIALATYIASQIADALAYLHDFRGLGLIHRDLTATNVMLSQTGDVKIIDFGIAKATLADDTLTQPHLVVGKPLWTAPEVRQGYKPDRRTDLYALGLLYWSLVTGEDPVDHLDEKIGAQLPAPSTFRQDIPGDLEKVILHSVHVHPQRRFQTAESFRNAMSPFLPNGYNGAGGLAALVRGHQLTSEDKYFAELVERARPLLQPTVIQPPAVGLQSAVDSEPSPPKRNRRPLLLVGAAGLLSVTAFVAFHARTPARPPIRSQPTVSAAPRIPQPTLSPTMFVPAPTPSEKPSSTPPPQPPSVSPPVASATHGRQPPLPFVGKAPKSFHPFSSTPEANPPAEATPPQPPPPDGQALLAAARAAVAAGDNARAVRLLRVFIDVQPSSAAYILLARASWSDKSAARTALDTALRLSPGDPVATKLLNLLERSHPGAPSGLK